MVRISGLQDLFEKHGLDARFLDEQQSGLYPDSDDLVELKPASSEAFELCPNPWTTLFVAENGDVHLCFLAEPVGNLYQAPLLSVWNSPKAIGKRSDMIAGRYMQSGCSQNWCSWREGKSAPPPAGELRSSELESRRVIEETAAGPLPVLQTGMEPASKLGAIRRMLDERDRRLTELERLRIHDAERTRQHIAHLEAKTQKAIDDFRLLEQEMIEIGEREARARECIERDDLELQAREMRAQEHIRHLEERLSLAISERDRMRRSPLVRFAGRVSGLDR